MSEFLVTGGEGFVGRNIMERLGPRGESFDLKSGKDILNREQLAAALENKIAVIHLAARISVTESMVDPAGYYLVNTEGTRAVVEEAIKAGVTSLVFYSSAAAREPSNSPYGDSKFRAEQLLQDYKNDIHITIFEPENIIGKGQSNAYAGVLTIFANNAREGNPIIVSGDGSQTRDFVYVGDMVNLTLKALENRDNIPSGTIFQVGTGNSVVIKDVAEEFGRRGNVTVLFDPSMPVGIMHSKANNEPLLEAVGGYSFRSWRDVLPEMA